MAVNASRVEQHDIAAEQRDQRILRPSEFFDPTFLTTLRSEIGAHSFERLLKTCLEDVEMRLERLKMEAERGDANAARATAHQLLGIFGHVGAKAGAKAARAVMESTDDDAAACIELLRKDGNLSVAELRAITNAGVD